MGNASDQGVIEMLQRLEDRGMLEKRTSGQARSLKLTSDALLAIGVSASQMGAPSGVPMSGSLELRSDQQQIYNRLSEIDPKLARMYEGGLRALLDESNPERIVQSAHSIRESTY